VKAIALLVVVVALVSAAAGSAATGFWFHNTSHYRCGGDRLFVICHSLSHKKGVNAYRVMIDGENFWVSYGGKLIYQCWTRRLPFECRTVP